MFSKKSVAVSVERDLLIDEYLMCYPMPIEYAAWRAVILCNDCVTESEVAYHFAFHRCPRPTCRSYNTDVLRVNKGSAADGDEDAQRRGPRPQRRERPSRIAAAALVDDAGEQKADEAMAVGAVEGDGLEGRALPEAYHSALANGADARTAIERGWVQILDERDGDEEKVDDGEAEDADDFSDQDGDDIHEAEDEPHADPQSVVMAHADEGHHDASHSPDIARRSIRLRHVDDGDDEGSEHEPDPRIP